MSQPVIELEGVGKRYRLGEHLSGVTDLREAIAGLVGRVIRRERKTTSDFWSLRDVSFSVHQGDAIGIVGRNGAGKSTLLKVISHITTPTVGSCRTRGRIGSLLEVGTGFHPDLTGLENTFLNGAILGMKRTEVARRLDEIVAFAGLERFMDTPVKRYSSGMFLRLGFAIAAHLEADILVVDEVLAVGDAEFQRRCLGKMGDVERSGRTVLFVSHNMEALHRLCPTSIWLDEGAVRMIGPSPEVIAAYTRTNAAGAGAAVTFEASGPALANLTRVAIVDASGDPQTVLNSWVAPTVEVDVNVNEPVAGLDVGVVVSSARGATLFDENLRSAARGEFDGIGTYRVRASFPAVLTPGEYAISVWLGTSHESLDFRENALSLIVDGDDGDRSDRLVRLDIPWSIDRLGTSPDAP